MVGACIDPIVAALLGVSLAGVFAQAAWHKASDLQGAAQVVADYEITPVAWARVHAILAMAAEACVAAGFFVGAGSILASTPAAARLSGASEAASLGALALLCAYSIAIGVNLVRGRRDIDCGCTGPAGASPRIGPWLLGRNAVLGLAALALLAWPLSPRPLHWVDAVSLIGGFAGLALSWLAVHGLASAADFDRRSHRRSVAPGSVS